MLHILKIIIIIFEEYAWINIPIGSALMEDVHVLPFPDYCSNAIICNSFTVFITFLVLFSVIDSFFGRVIVTGIKYINFDSAPV
jgi:hypothetical protein